MQRESECEQDQGVELDEGGPLLGRGRETIAPSFSTALRGHLFFASIIGAAISLAASPTTPEGSLVPGTSAAALAVQCSYSGILLNSLRALRQIGDAISLPSIAVVWACSDLQPSPLSFHLSHALRTLCIAALAVPALQLLLHACGFRDIRKDTSVALGWEPTLPLLTLALLRTLMMRHQGSAFAQSVCGRGPVRFVLGLVLFGAVRWGLTHMPMVCPTSATRQDTIKELRPAAWIVGLIAPTGTLLSVYLLVPCISLPLRETIQQHLRDPRARGPLTRALRSLPWVTLVVAAYMASSQARWCSDTCAFHQAAPQQMRGLGPSRWHRTTNTCSPSSRSTPCCPSSCPPRLPS
jgi:hypothetical protein